jgi:hypothetical protein
LYSSYINVLLDASVHSEHGKVIKCDFKPGSVERSIPKRVYLRRRYVQLPPPIKNENFSQWLFSVVIKTHRPFFKFDSIKDILEA